MYELHKCFGLEVWKEVPWWPDLVSRGGTQGLVPPRDKHTIEFGPLLAVLGFQLKVGPTPFSSSHREQSGGAAASDELTAVDVQVFKLSFLGSVSGKIPELLVLSRASQVLRKQL